MVCARPRSGRRRFEETIAGFGTPQGGSCAADYHTAVLMRFRQRQQRVSTIPWLRLHTCARACVRRLLSCDTRAQQKSEWPLHTQCALIRNLPTLCHLTRATAIRRLNTILCPLLIFSVCIKHFLNYDIQLQSPRSWFMWEVLNALECVWLKLQQNSKYRRKKSFQREKKFWFKTNSKHSSTPINKSWIVCYQTDFIVYLWQSSPITCLLFFLADQESYKLDKRIFMYQLLMHIPKNFVQM